MLFNNACVNEEFEMKKGFMTGKKWFPFVLLVGVVALSGFIIGFKFSDTDYLFRISKGIDIFGHVYKEVTMNYVDEVDPEKFMEGGIDGMLGALDPYTNFIGENEGDEVELITSGKYGGIGVTIGLRDGYITILSLLEGYSAQRQGLQPGDRILEIDGKPVIGVKPDAIRSMTRGEPGTEVRMKIDREGEKAPLNFVCVREEILLKNITYADFIDSGIAYVRLERFSRGAGDELRLAIKDLKMKGTIKGVILDLRDNPGGLLDVAVDVVEKFVPKGSLIVSTHGRQPESEKKYIAAEEPMLLDVPLLVLVNHNSASASEIVAGAIQDLDRGIIFGTRTFGKGLVQTILPLVYGTQLKITTAKYYTPSGRCIQEIDYMHKSKDGVFTVTPDSLRRGFKTLKGRSVFESGGVTPDSVAGETETGAMYKELLRKSMFFKFATKYVSQHKDSTRPVPPQEEVLGEFQKFLDEQQFTYQDEGEKKVSELSEIAEQSKYSPTIREEIERLRKDLGQEKKYSLDRDKANVLRGLMTELMLRYKGDAGRIAASLENDEQAKAAASLLLNGKEYSRLLSVKKTK